ncbi:hypothetical protein Acr_10g0001390 [Actinidia rufa]|uniref:NB-ARC domain-containing disease resistance protein n=1 Tax=Actinidia rufa TaxID=165716 RepID=A0A7J0F7S5_9ERIC|nr:hypothetical protein Acr_10g0001390 [Actinidia rufa]
MGGLGKTTIARKLYNTNNLRDKFKFSGWVSVSKDYNIGDLLRRTIKSLKTSTTKEEFEMLEKMKEEDLESYLRNLLNEGRYLVVLDDVWDVKVWASLRGAFPDNRNGSRIIITTREKVVANLHNERTYVHELPFLGEVESWELFYHPVNHSQQTASTGLPDEIGKLIHLRYLRLPATMINELSPFIVEGQMEFNPMDLINLRELLVSITGQNNRFTLDSIGRLRSLQSFSLFFGQEDAPLFPPLKPLSHCQHLLELTLWNSGYGWKLPTELHEFLPNLKYLCLVAYSMPEDPMPILEKLPNLTFLELGLYCLNKLACAAGGFPQLKFLQIYGNGAQELQVEEGGIPLLKGLSVLDSVKIPERLRSIPAIPWINN